MIIHGQGNEFDFVDGIVNAAEWITKLYLCPGRLLLCIFAYLPTTRGFFPRFFLRLFIFRPCFSG